MRWNSSISPSRSVEVGDRLQHTRTGGPDRARDADQLVGLGLQGGRRLPQAGAVVDGAAGREAESTGGDALGSEACHLGDVVGGRRLLRRATFTHHVEPERSVRDLCAEVDVAWASIEVVEVLGERLPLPRETLVQGGTGNVLDAFHELDQPLAVVLVHRSEPDAAVAHDDRRDTVPRRRGELGVPRRLTVRSGCGCRRSRVSRGDPRRPISRVPPPATSPMSVHDAVGHGDVTGEPVTARPVDDRPVADHQIVRSHDSPLRLRGDHRTGRPKTRAESAPGSPWLPSNRPASADRILWPSSASADCGRPSRPSRGDLMNRNPDHRSRRRRRPRDPAGDLRRRTVRGWRRRRRGRP